MGLRSSACGDVVGDIDGLSALCAEAEVAVVLSWSGGMKSVFSLTGGSGPVGAS